MRSAASQRGPGRCAAAAEETHGATELLGGRERPRNELCEERCSLLRCCERRRDRSTTRLRAAGNIRLFIQWGCSVGVGDVPALELVGELARVLLRSPHE